MEFLEKLEGNSHAGAREEEEISVSQVMEEKKKEDTANTGNRMTWKQHPKYAVFFRQVEVGVPVEAVKAKMRLNGFDPSVMEWPRWHGLIRSNDPNSFVPAAFM